MTDILGCLLAIKVHAANIHDTIAGFNVYRKAKEKYDTLTGVCADAGYRGTFKDLVEAECEDKVDISEKIKPKGWEILPKRWRVERTFAWGNGWRILSKDYEIATKSQENVFMIAHLHLLLRRY